MFVQTNRVKDVKALYHEKLSPFFSESEINLMVKYLTIKRLNINAVEFVSASDNLLSESDLLYFHFALKRLLKNEPFQHVLGDVEFYGLELLSDARALIPRPETEELVDWVISSFKEQQLQIVDLCAGSGCIALAVKSRFSNSEVIATELSEKAIELIEANCLKTKLQLTIHKMDVLMDEDYRFFKQNAYDCWISNPPYIPTREKSIIDKNVLDFEPHLALFVADDDPLIFYSKIADQARVFLKDNGLLFFEIHENYGQEMISLLAEKGFVNIELRKDLQGKERMLRAQNVISNHESK